jgi:hypothetical protein
MLGIETKKEEEAVMEDEVVEAAEAAPAQQQEPEVQEHLSEGDSELIFLVT